MMSADQTEDTNKEQASDTSASLDSIVNQLRDELALYRSVLQDASAWGGGVLKLFLLEFRLAIKTAPHYLLCRLALAPLMLLTWVSFVVLLGWVSYHFTQSWGFVFFSTFAVQFLVSVIFIFYLKSLSKNLKFKATRHEIENVSDFLSGLKTQNTAAVKIDESKQ